MHGAGSRPGLRVVSTWEGNHPLARVAGRRWAVEECFEAAKQERVWPIARPAPGAGCIKQPDTKSP